MEKLAIVAVATAFFGVLTLADGVALADPATAGATADVADRGFRQGEAGLSSSARAGREIWYKSTAGNSRFHSYTFPQRIGVLIDWYRVLNSPERDDRFAAWGIINDPDCCTPGSEGCPARSLEETYGFDWCPGDEHLLSFVGREGYRDPACDFRDAPVDPNDPHHRTADQRQSPCDLAFGTSTGALGFRKFPNPRFDAERWRAVNGSAARWEGYNRRLSKDPGSRDARVSHLADGSIEPPFLIGISCGSCHIAFDPLRPPKDPAHPAWENIKGAVGNQYSRIAEILGSGMPHETLEYQVFAHSRPGTSDTSAVPTDQVNNPGTMNAIINTARRPTFPGEQVVKWRKVAACSGPQTSCWCEPGREGKCWERSSRKETVHHILKGGEDSIGALEAIQRVYFNIGSCAEACWVNHLSDLRQLDPHARNFGQTPFRIGQCRRDCASFRAIEDRLPDILAFFLSSENDATDLHVARANELQARSPDATYTYDDLVADLDEQFGAGAVGRGRELFAENCARCHSSIAESEGGPFRNRDFRAVDPATGLRADWMGSDLASPASEVGTFRCRALHSNHMEGHVWEEYGSETLRTRPGDPSLKEPHDGGRGYYRGISLLSLWAHAPFMHNNAMGPEICGRPANAKNFFYRSPYFDPVSREPIASAPDCRSYDPSVDGRFDLFVASMRELLTPEEQRLPKITKFDVDVPLPFELSVSQDGAEKRLYGFTVVVPRGTNAGALGNFRHKAFFDDLVLARLAPETLEERLAPVLGEEGARAMAGELRTIGGRMMEDPAALIETARKHPEVLRAYSSCTDQVENAGHRFGTGLPDADKNALIAFLATL
jgi:hypothetical protein